VTASDWDDEALAYVQASAKLNELQIRTLHLDWRDPPPNLPAEIILAADVLYEDRNASDLAHALHILAPPGVEVWLTDPGRAYLPRFLQRVSGFTIAHTSIELIHDQIPKGRASIELLRLQRKQEAPVSGQRTR
jgi:predicted nicotinamide N-methyase